MPKNTSGWRHRIDLIVELFKYTHKYGPIISAVLVWAGGMGIVAAFTVWMNKYSPFSWYFSGAIGFLLAVSVVAISAKYSLWKAQEESLRILVQPTSPINPMDRNFHKLRFKFVDLAHPIERTVRGKVIDDCEIVGPGVMYLVGGSQISGSGFAGCDFIKCNLTATIFTATGVIDTAILNSQIYNMTILVPPNPNLISSFEATPNFPGWVAG